MIDPVENNLFDIPDYENTVDEAFPPLPPPLSPGHEDGDGDPFANGEDEGELSKLAEAPVAKRRFVRKPQPKLDSQRLVSERGLPALRTLFNEAHFKGKGHEAEDLRVVLQKMENWAHRLYPKLQFEDFVDRVETLGSKKEVQTCLKRIRLDMPLTHEDFIGMAGEEEGIFKEEPLVATSDRFQDVAFMDAAPFHSTPVAQLTDEQKHRIEMNKQQALERRMARMKGQPDASQSAATDDTHSKPSSQSLTQENEGADLTNHTQSPRPQDSPLPHVASPGLINGRDDSSD